jgi:hypothetical protein
MQARIIGIPESLLGLGRDTISVQGLPDDRRLRHSLRLGLIRIRRLSLQCIRQPDAEHFRLTVASGYS